MRVLMALVLIGLACTACDAKRGEPICGRTFEYAWRALIPGPAEDGHDADLAATARRRERQFHAIHATATGLNSDLNIPLDKKSERAKIASFLQDEDGWDFEASTGLSLREMVDSWGKSTGAFAGAGLAADAYRYGVLRDQCYRVEEVDRARQHLLRSLDGLHQAQAVAGVDGVIARAIAHTSYPGQGQVETTPLFDEDGLPLPQPKNNGTWREDNTGQFPDLIWEDSGSRDQYIGWVLGMSAAWEVIRGDDAIDGSYLTRLRDDARLLAHGLMEVRDSGYDLELIDADGRITFHGYLNEHNLERDYVPGLENGFYAIMALGTVAALADVSDDPAVRAYLDDGLLADRQLDIIARDHMMAVDVGVVSNYSNYNMAFDGAWLAIRHLDDPVSRQVVVEAIESRLYDAPDRDRQPSEIGQTFFDIVFAAARCGASVDSPCLREPDQAALDRGLKTLREYPEPPFWDFERVNCDEDEVASGICVAEDGTQLELLGYVGRGEKLVSRQPVPMRVRPPSNFYWRSNPYQVNGGSNGSGLIPGVDYRYAYWIGRWVARPVNF